ncbi:MAG: glycosyltransferase family 4 protein [Desulfomonile tiedjei]|nr:glycosyltransferase family 4 protein [Desulfomonile tiedjei]
MRIAILTNLRDLHDAYSLTSVVRHQVAMLCRYGHDVTVFASETFQDKTININSRYQCPVEPIIPAYEEIEYARLQDLTEDHQRIASQTSQIVSQRLSDFDLAVTHDWLFTAWNLPLAESVRLSKDQTRHVRFLHWIHSVPSEGFNWWGIKRYGRNHKLIYPNRIDRVRVATMFGGDSRHVRTVPHATDLRLLFDFCDETWNVIDAYPSLMQAQFVQVYPVSGARLSQKGLSKLILLFKALKSKGFSVCLLIADSNATGRVPRDDLEPYKRMAERNGLSKREFGFTSDLNYERGLPRHILRELMQCANLFIYPTEAESFGLTLPEACLAGGVLPVLNRSLSVLMGTSGGYGLFFDFGSAEKCFEPQDEREYYQWMADMIVARAKEDDCWQARTFMRQTYNIDTIYRGYYAPLLTESCIWN